MHSLNDSILNIVHILAKKYSWQLFSDKANKTILNFFSCRKVSNILPMQNLQNTFLLMFFISDLIRDEEYGRPTTVNAVHFGLLLFQNKQIYEYANIK